jgi:hypothetical protein
MFEKLLSMSGGAFMTVHGGTSGRLFGCNCTLYAGCSHTLGCDDDRQPLVLDDVSECALAAVAMYGSIQVALHAGGERHAVDPLSAPVFSSGPGLMKFVRVFASPRVKSDSRSEIGEMMPTSDRMTAP